QDEEDGGGEVTELDQVLVHFGPFSRNIFSIRSVIRKPETMLVIDAATGRVPRIVVRSDARSPAMSSDPTTAMAEIALVSDISGVCRRRETFWITWNPTNVASMNTNNIDQRSRVGMT